MFKCALSPSPTTLGPYWEIKCSYPWDIHSKNEYWKQFIFEHPLCPTKKAPLKKITSKTFLFTLKHSKKLLKAFFSRATTLQRHCNLAFSLINYHLAHILINVKSSYKRHKASHKEFIYAPSTLPRRNLKTKFFILKTHQVFSVHSTPEKCENAAITGHFEFVFEENSGGKIT